MNSPIFFALAGFLQMHGAGSALAQGTAEAPSRASSGACVAIKDATPENFRSCPEKVKIDILMLAPPVTIKELEGRVLRTGVDGGFIDSSEAPALLLSVKDGKACMTGIGYDLTRSSLSEAGVFAALNPAVKCIEPKSGWASRIRQWKGLFLGWSSGMVTVLSEEYPLDPDRAIAVVQDQNRAFPERIDALPSVIKHLPPSAAGTLVTGWLSEVGIRKHHSPGLIRYLRELKDLRMPRILAEVLEDSVVPDPARTILLDDDIAAGMTYEVVSGYILKVFNQRDGNACGGVRGRMVRYARISAELEARLPDLLHYCVIRQKSLKNEYLFIFLPAFQTAESLRMKNLVPDISDVLRFHRPFLRTPCQGNVRINRGFEDTLIAGLHALGVLGDASAYDVIHDSAYYNNQCSERLAEGARKAERELSVTLAIAGILKGDQAQLQWSFDFIRNHDGEAKDSILRLLGALKSALAVSGDAARKIREFARQSLDFGYHAYDPEITRAEQALLN